MTSIRKSLGVLLLALALGVLALPAPVTASGAEHVVYPTGLFPQDLENVQAAVDAGGTALLKATDADGNATAFNFGPPEPSFSGSSLGAFVRLSNDVTILGETTGPHMTTIQGGFPAFFGIDPVESAIRGIHFDSPGNAALFLVRSSGAEFSNNLVTNVVGLPNYLGLGISKGQAVWVTSGGPAVHGDLVIADNVIDGIDAELGYGVALFGFDAEARVVRNEFRGMNTAGVLVGLHSSSVWIEDNVIMPGPERFPDPPGISVSAGNGITVASSLGGPSYIRRNTVVCENPFADGIIINATAAFGDDQDRSVIKQNRVEMNDSFFGAISLVGDVTNTYVGQNLLSGSGAFALPVERWFPQDIQAGNTFVGNNISRFESQVADVFLDINSRNTVLVGNGGTVIDLGEDNQITGVSVSSGAAIGKQIKSAQEVRRESLEARSQMETAARVP